MQTTPERLGEALQRTRNRWRRRSSDPVVLPAATRKPAFAIAISRESGAGGASIAREVGARLDWPVYDRELLEAISEESGLQKELLENLEEHETNRAAEWLESLFVSTTVTKSQFAHRLVQTLSALAARARHHCWPRRYDHPAGIDNATSTTGGITKNTDRPHSGEVRNARRIRRAANR